MAVHVRGLGADVDHDTLRLHCLAQDGRRQQAAQVQPVALDIAERQACMQKGNGGSLSGFMCSVCTTWLMMAGGSSLCRHSRSNLHVASCQAFIHSPV